LSKDSLIADLQNPLQNVKNAPCKLGRILLDVSDAEREQLDKSIETIRNDSAQAKNKVYSSVWLSKVLRSHGYGISVSTVQRHVNKECFCDQSDK